MFSTSSSRSVTIVCVAMMMMMMMMTEAAAMPKGGSQSKHRTHHRKPSDDGVAIETVSLQLDPKLLIPTRPVRQLENASISPWTYNTSMDDSLYPPQLSEARCLLTGCLDSTGQEDLNLESRPILRQVLLLRRVRSTEAGPGAGPGYHFRLESRLIAVGCTCVRLTVQHQN